MESQSLEWNFLSVFSLICFFSTLLISKFSGKFMSGLLLDDDFSKPQGFHFQATPRAGGLVGLVAILIFIFLYNFIFNIFLLDYLTLSLILFLLGFIDDIKLKLNPNNRLTLMIILILFFIITFDIKINNLDINFINFWLQNKLFETLFVLLCFLFIINGSNLIDGFNGLLTIHLLIINSILLAINSKNPELEINIVLISQITILLLFLLFNFPKAKMFLGDSGSYLFGGFTVLNIIYTNNLNSDISSFFFSILVFYLFYEVFFSFFRKIYLKRSPLKPDNYHLHMNTFKFLKSLNYFKDSNYITSIFINFIYLIVISPAIILKSNGTFCRYWFFCLLILYTISYFKFANLLKKSNDN